MNFSFNTDASENHVKKILNALHEEPCSLGKISLCFVIYRYLSIMLAATWKTGERICFYHFSNNVQMFIWVENFKEHWDQVFLSLKHFSCTWHISWLSALKHMETSKRRYTWFTAFQN